MKRETLRRTKGNFTALSRNQVLCEATSSIERISAMDLQTSERERKRGKESTGGILAGIWCCDNLVGTKRRT